MKFKTSVVLTAMAVIATMLYVTACESPSRLASKIEGAWSGTSERFDKKVVGDGTYTPVYEFTRTENRPEGTVLLSAQVSVTMPINSQVNADGTAPVSATAAGLATVRGIWTADDDDEVKIAFDPSTLTVTMDPDVQFAIADVYTAFDTDSTATVTPQVMKAFREQVERGINDVVARVNEFDDIHFNSDQMMTAKVGKTRRTFAKAFGN